MENEEKSTEAKKRGNPNEAALRNIIIPHTREIVEKLLYLMRSGDNANVQLGAANTLLKKVIPDLKTTEIVGELQADGSREPIKLFVNAGQGFVPATFALPTAPTTSIATSTGEIQSINLASESKKDVHSDNGDGQTGTP